MESSRFIRLLFGLILIILASALLLNNLGLPDLSQIVRKLFWPLIVIAVGVFLFFSSSPQGESKPKASVPAADPPAEDGPRLRESKIAGELHMVPAGTYQKVLADLTFGKCVVDLTHTTWENGTGVADIQCLVGEVVILIPAGLGVTYTCQCFIGAIHAEGRNQESIGNHLNLKTLPDANASAIDLRVNLAIGEIKVFRV